MTVAVLKKEQLSLTPIVSESIKEWLEDPKRVFTASDYHKGPVHIIFPENMTKNINDLKQTMDDMGLQYRIFFAHKPTKSAAFIRQALYSNIGLDVASENELVSALSAGFTGDNIECTGVKSNAFLELALRHKCLVVADSIGELNRMKMIKQQCNLLHKTNILIRVSDVRFADRQQKLRHSRFGVPQNALAEVLEFFDHNDDFIFKGYHLHNDERESDIRAGQLESLLTMMEDAYRLGHEPIYINIGGGLRRKVLENYDSWAHFVNALEESLMEHRDAVSWERYGYGMRLNDKGKVMGRGAVQGLIPNIDFTQVLKDMFTSNRQRGRELGAIITENGFDVITEPGNALLDQCGISLFTVIETKQSRDGANLVLMDANMYNLAVPMREYLLDPIHIPRSKNEDFENLTYEGYLIGNLCREEDFLMRRKLSFKQKPQAGDIIAFINTAAYKMDFENANPHLHSDGRKIVAYKKEGQWFSCSEDAYNPYEAGDIK
tara:strand:+ start:99 stop:1574 length:1476 start_codon:yes stop_codon:yes gene_type:complete